MNLNAIITEIADQADDFLEGVTSPEQARAAISEMITMRATPISPADRTAVIDGVMSILQEEGFFEWKSAGDGLDDESGAAEEE